jgi:hypothetical protein
MINWPSSLVSDIARRRCVIFIGSGISKNSINAQGKSPKSWSEFLNFAKKSARSKTEITKLLKNNDFLTACEAIKMDIGQDQFNSLLIDEFLTPGFAASEYHKAIFRLDSRLVATPNFDKIYETYANNERNASIRIKHHFDGDVADALRREDRLILKIHGTIDTPNRMIFTRNEYAEARSKYSAFYKIVESLALTHTFLFLGCGVSDPDIRLLLEDIFFRHELNRPHVFTLPKNAIGKLEQSILQKTMDLQILTYDPRHSHRLLLESLNKLVEKVDLKRDELKVTGNW